MDKYEFKLKVDEMKALVNARNYKAAAEIAETINWRKIRNLNALVLAGEVFEQVERYEESKEILLMAYDKSPIGRNIIYRLAEIAIKTRNFEEAKEYYDEFVDIAPHDNLKFVLKYKMTAAQGFPYKEQIQILEELKEQEYSEEWAYELAYLYHRDGQPEKCVEACDELILWFGDGIYVEKALELKMHYQPLTKTQEEKYRLFRQKRTGVIEVKPEDFLESGEIVNEAVEIPSVVASPERFNTTNLQNEIAKGMQQIINATEKEDVSDAIKNIKRATGEIPYLSLIGAEEEEKARQQEAEETAFEDEIDRQLDQSMNMILNEDQRIQGSAYANPEEAQTEQEKPMSIEEILAEWEKTKLATQAVLRQAEERKLESAKEKALQEAEKLLDRLMGIMPQLTAGVTPKELLEQEYLQGTGILDQQMQNTAEVQEDLEEAGKIVAGMNKLLQEQIDTLTEGGKQSQGEAVPQHKTASPTRELPDLSEEALEAEGAYAEEFPQSAPGEIVYVEQTQQGMPEENVYVEQVPQGIPEEGVYTEQVPQEMLEEGVYAEQVPQEMLEKGVYAEQVPQEMLEEGVYAEQAPKKLPEESMCTEQTLQGMPGEGIHAEETEAGIRGEAAYEAETIPDSREAVDMGRLEEQLEEAAVPVQQNTIEMQQRQAAERLARKSLQTEAQMRDALNVGIAARQRLQAQIQQRNVPDTELAAKQGLQAEEQVQSVPDAELVPKQNLQAEEQMQSVLDTELVPRQNLQAEAQIQDVAKTNVLSEKKVETTNIKTDNLDEYQRNIDKSKSKEVMKPQPEQTVETNMVSGQKLQETQVDKQENKPVGNIQQRAELEYSEADRTPKHEYSEPGRIPEREHPKPGRVPEQGYPKPGRIPEQGYPEPGQKQEREESKKTQMAHLPLKEGPRFRTQAQLQKEAELEDTEEFSEEDMEAAAQAAGFSKEVPPKNTVVKQLTPEQRQVFSYFIPILGMEAQIYDVLQGVSKHLKWDQDALTGNFVVEGISGSGKTVLIMNIIKVLQKETQRPNHKIGKIDANALNQKDMEVLTGKVSGGCLIIESAGKISRETAVKLSECMEKDTVGTLYVLEDTKQGIQKALERDSFFAAKFTEKISIPIFTNDDLVAFAKVYANDLDYDIDEMGILALYKRISSIQKLDHVTTLAEVKEIVDEAIDRAERGTLKKVLGIFKPGRYNNSNYVILREKDFEEQ